MIEEIEEIEIEAIAEVIDVTLIVIENLEMVVTDLKGVSIVKKKDILPKIALNV